MDEKKHYDLQIMMDEATDWGEEKGQKSSWERRRDQEGLGLPPLVADRGHGGEGGGCDRREETGERREEEERMEEEDTGWCEEDEGWCGEEEEWEGGGTWEGSGTEERGQQEWEWEKH